MFQCNHHSSMRKHAAGAVTTTTACYPQPMARMIIKSFFPHVTWKHVPSMPCVLAEGHPHRLSPAVPCIPIGLAMYELGAKSLPLHAGVHKLIDRKHWVGNQAAMEAIQSEKGGLLQEGAWDDSSIMEQYALIAWANREKLTAHVGSIMAVCVLQKMKHGNNSFLLHGNLGCFCACSSRVSLGFCFGIGIDNKW